MQRRAIGLFLLSALLFLRVGAAVPAGPPAEGPGASQRTYRILFLDPQAGLVPWNLSMLNACRDELQRLTGTRVEVFAENISMLNNDSPVVMETTLRLLDARYAGKVDFIVMRRFPDNFHRIRPYLPGVPLVLPAVDQVDLARQGELPQQVYVASIRHSPARTADAAVTLCPAARKLVVVSGHSAFGRLLEARAREEMGSRYRGIAVSYASGLPFDDLRSTIASLPADHLVLFLIQRMDRNRVTSISKDVVERIAAESPVPVFGIASTYLAGGIVGGYLDASEIVGARAATMLHRLVRGDPPPPVSPVAEYGQYRFDWRQMRRWGLSERHLPDGARVVNRPASFSARHPWALPVLTLAAVALAGSLALLLFSMQRRSRYQRAIRESELKYRQLFDGADVLVSVYDRNGVCRLMNRKVAGLFNGRPADFIGRSLTDLHSDHGDEYMRRIREVIDTGATHDYEDRIAFPQGDCWLLTRVHPVRDGNGQIDTAQVISHDITTLKAAQADREALQNQLFQARKMESIGTLAGGIAHDFNNILASIIGFTELALDDADPGSDQEDSLREIFSAGTRARALVKGLLSFARQSEDARTPITVGAAVEEALTLIRASLPSTITVRSNIDSQSRVLANAAQLHQIVLNLCTNAAAAMDASGGRLDVRVSDVRHTAAADGLPDGLEPGGYVQLQVADSGHGIPAKDLDSIFDPYFTTRPPGEGSGMGLAVVHGIVERYRGKITVSSRPGRGAVFRIWLPAVERTDLRGGVESSPSV